MSKATVTRLFIGSSIAAVAGVILTIAAVWIAIVNDVFVLSGADIVGLHGSPLSWALFGIGVVGLIGFVGGLVGGLVSWIGALLNTAQLTSKAWFVAMLLLGIFNFGILAMLAYVIVGPESDSRTEHNGAPAPVAA